MISMCTVSLVFTALALVLAMVGPPQGETHESAPKANAMTPPHHQDGRFRNPWPGAQLNHGFKEFLRWRRERKDGERPIFKAVVNTLPLAEPDWAVIHSPGDSLVVTWLGHASFLIQAGGVNILTDPMFSERASPVQWAGARRVTPVPLDPDRLPPIDVVVISHNHYDHLDRGTVRRLGNGPTWYVPLKMRRWFVRQGITNVVELDWWEQSEYGDLEIACTPAKHFSQRNLLNFNKVLWCSWVISGGGQMVYFAGDTGYGPHFGEVRERAGPIDLALLPIGAYNPEWFMLAVHLNPAQAVQAHLALGATRTIGMHWGTFILTDEPLEEPPRLFRQAARAHGLGQDEAIIMRHGETVVLP